MALSDDEKDLVVELQRELNRTRKTDLLMQRYYQGLQRVEQLGMAIPPNMRNFLVIVNWPRVVVDTVVARQKVRALILPGEEEADPELRAIAEANNLPAHLKMFNRDRCVFGRGFLSVGANEASPKRPWVRVESPLNMAALVDVKTETMTAAGRFYRSKPLSSSAPAADRLTLYLPEKTVHAARGRNGWEEIEDDRDDHGLGKVPIIMHLNRRLSGQWVGESEMTDIIPLTDAAVRSLTNLQFAQEAHGIPRVGMVGASKGDFLDEKGNPLPQWEAYWDAIYMLTNPAGKITQLTPADLKNFETALTIYGRQAATVTGFPSRYFGLTTTNPPSADAIRSEEAELVRGVEDDNDEVGMSLGWAASLAYEFATGTEVEGNRVRVDWFDPGTPTVGMRTDAAVKLRQVGVISREGVWDELGWSDARKDKERARLAAEAAEDPELDAARALTGANQPNANAV